MELKKTFRVGGGVTVKKKRSLTERLKDVAPHRVGIAATGPYAEWDLKKNEAPPLSSQVTSQSEPEIAEDVALKYAEERPNRLTRMQTPIVRNEQAEDGKNRIVAVEWPRKPHGWVTSTLLIDPKLKTLLRVISETVR